MSETPELLLMMKAETKAQLAEDLEQHGLAAQGLTVFEIRRRFGIGPKRATRLNMWLKHHGMTSPLIDQVAAGGEGELRDAAHSRSHLIFGDAHAEPHNSLARFLWAGRMAADLLRPGDLAMWMGDWYDLASMRRGATALERSRERVRAERESGEEALELYHRGLDAKADEIDNEVVEGNHDRRLQSYADENPQFEGLFDVWAKHKEKGWRVTPFLEPRRVNGVCYQHYLQNYQSDRAIAGKYAAARVIETVSYQESMVVGHSHLLHIAHRGMAYARHCWGISAGCFFDYDPEYARRGVEQWWRGAILLKNVENGSFDLELFPMDTIRRRWGG